MVFALTGQIVCIGTGHTNLTVHLNLDMYRTQIIMANLCKTPMDLYSYYYFFLSIYVVYAQCNTPYKGPVDFLRLVI